MANRFEDWVEGNRCFLCTRNAKISVWTDYYIECERCGAFYFERLLTRTMSEDEIKMLRYLSIRTREASDRGEPIRIDSDNWKRMALATKDIPFAVKVKKFLTVAAGRKPIGHSVKFDMHADLPLVYAVDKLEFGALFAHLVRNDYVTGGSLDGSLVLTGKAWQELQVEQPPELASRCPASGTYVSPTRIEELKSLYGSTFDLSKLIRMCEEINICFDQKCYLAVAMLARAILDHVPPIFSCKKFAEVANNYAGAKSFKESMNHLENSSRKIADSHMHQQIRGTESLPNETQVNFSNDLDVLLGEIVRILK